MTNSNWKPIPSLQNQYEANEYGQIRSVRRKSTRGRIIKPYISPHNGYVYVVTSVNNEQKTQRVHKLVAEAFFGDANGRQINHKDGNKQNNAAENLEYCTQSENMKHAYKTGLEKPRGIKIINTETGTVFAEVSVAITETQGLPHWTITTMERYPNIKGKQQGKRAFHYGGKFTDERQKGRT